LGGHREARLSRHSPGQRGAHAERCPRAVHGRKVQKLDGLNVNKAIFPFPMPISFPFPTATGTPASRHYPDPTSPATTTALFRRHICRRGEPTQRQRNAQENGRVGEQTACPTHGQLGQDSHQR